MLSLAERYCQCWHVDPHADSLEQFLSAHPGLSDDQLLEVLLADQALRWQAAAGPSVERYLTRFPGIAAQTLSVLELVCGEMRAASKLGLVIDVGKYEGRFPTLVEPLRRQAEVLQWLQLNASPSDPKANFKM